VFYIGVYGAGGPSLPVTGTIDEVVTFTREINSTERGVLYNSGAGLGLVSSTIAGGR